MLSTSFFKRLSENRFLLLCWLLVALGLAFRLIIFFQNRNLIIDEANVVRNVYERGYLGLLKPLRYEQYAPPAYLWCLEFFSHVLGYSEQAMRLTALLCGIGLLFAFWWLLRQILPRNSYWLPLGLLCFAPIAVKYSAEVKQYMPDAFVAVSLVCMALKTDIMKLRRSVFVGRWMLLGSIAIWASQPAVFTLAAVGGYYAVQSIHTRRWNLFALLVPIGMVWLAQFALYYELILKTQINSDYLQGYHRDYFLFAAPANREEWRHNWVRIKEILNNTSGYNYYSWHYSIVFMLLGAVYLVRKSAALFVLIVCPVALTLLAAALHQFSLIERVVLFILPFTMIIVGCGFAFLMSYRFLATQTILLLVGVFMLREYNMRSLFFEKFVFQEVTYGLDYIMAQNGQGKELYVDCATKDAYVYYTEIHPQRSRYTSLLGAYQFGWQDRNFWEVAAGIATPRSFFIFTGGGDDHRNQVLSEVAKELTPVHRFDSTICHVITFSKIQTQ